MYILDSKNKRHLAKNLIAATYAPMHPDGTLNLGKIKEYSQFLKRNCIEGVFMNGSTGDFASLTAKERMEITNAWAQNKSSNLYLINQVGDLNLDVAKELALHSADKVDAISVLAPFYFKLYSIEKLVEYCKVVAACVPKLPFYYYHIPELSRANFKMEDFVKSASENIPNFAGIKFTSSNLNDFNLTKEFDKGKYNVLFGCDDIFLTSLLLGAGGWVGSTYNHLAPLYYRIKELVEKEQMSDAKNLQKKAIRFIEILDGKGGFNGVGKGFMKALGLDLGPSRFPHKTISDIEIKEILELLIEEDIFPYLSE